MQFATQLSPPDCKLQNILSRQKSRGGLFCNISGKFSEFNEIKRVGIFFARLLQFNKNWRNQANF
jgi:hypothetical protein